MVKKLFSYFNGKLECVDLLDTGLASPECTVETYLCRDKDGKQFRCAKSMYHDTIREAMGIYLHDCVQSLPAIYNDYKQQLNQLNFVSDEINRVQIELSLVK